MKITLHLSATEIAALTAEAKDGGFYSIDDLLRDILTKRRSAMVVPETDYKSPCDGCESDACADCPFRNTMAVDARPAWLRGGE